LRDRKRNRCPLRGSWPITACTRSARRSNPQRMSVASAASQIRGPGAPSNARRLGRPITTPAPTQIEAGAGEPHQTPALPSSSSRGDDEARPQQIASMLAPVLTELLSRQRQRMWLRAYASASSTHTTATPATRAHDKTLPRSCRWILAPIQHPAIAIYRLLCSVP